MNTTLPLWGWVVIPLLLLAQGVWLFMDASKHGRHPWLWGVLGLVQLPLPILVYYFFVRKQVLE
ncbi:hypothetical protein [Shouchella lonarensis]|uniref:Sigma-Y antisigma factor component n=1 Tax=Shouchella lonarensis TaxID=1464122 RepID=A0A1G6GPB7_9BACI|nr:hypothetical protein [Shouchella lonarensis]SDB83788.1 hypothetical protein SAMN05421737_101321 [Shouchella lonarensis]